ncbi:hypothetical protein FH972_022271 [Carpinus fangiana]|uniref:Formamidopyrimidine-DNA glycosylase catalytic domain-containing protein n=1 Tax=Carpinus fangiana TaxID=176857 RepID=A0A5N6KS43_9ROSI|nr:hypothetical protein FH972_022271 [Carpinus fangiana]
MPEIAEVARCVHFLRQHVVNRRIASVLTSGDDPIIYLTSKTGLDASKLVASLQGKKVVAAKQQGKYFWLEIEKPPHLLLHLGMTGWIKFKGDESADYQQMSKNAKTDEDTLKDDENGDPAQSVLTPAEDWPPRFWKFILKMEDGREAAFVDPRRLGRVRLIDAPASQMRNTSPLKENGPDPVIDADMITPEWFKNTLQSKKVPVKSLLLDQAVLSGVGNWVADETLYHARIHPETYCNTLAEKETTQLREALLDVCKTACDVLGDSSRFPTDWLMIHRWSKAKNGKGSTKLPNGETLSFVTVGGRTSAFVAQRQKKSGATAESRAGEKESTKGPVKIKASKASSTKQNPEDDKVIVKTQDPRRSNAKRSTRASASIVEDEPEEKSIGSARKKRRVTSR